MKKCVITIGRQCGSGGHTIGKTVAERLGIPFYDKKLVQIVAERSGLSAETVRREGEYSSASSLFTSVSSRGYSAYNANQRGNMALPDQVNAYQTELIKELAEKESCVIVGRCADYALADRDNVVNLFIYGREEAKTQRIMERYNLSESKARDMIIKKDKQRQSYYNYYSSKKWGRADSYDLCINSSVLGVDGTVKLVIQYVEDFEKKN